MYLIPKDALLPDCIIDQTDLNYMLKIELRCPKETKLFSVATYIHVLYVGGMSIECIE